MYRFISDHLDLRQIAESGQTFRFTQLEKGYYCVRTDDKELLIRQLGTVGSECAFEAECSEEEWKALWFPYFDMGRDYGAVEARILEYGDEHLIQSFNEGRGIRILKQDPWEMIITFLISQNNNISRIRNSIERICQKARTANAAIPEGAFPKAGEVDPEMFMDKSLGLGYRDTYLRDMYAYTAENPGWIEDLEKLDYDAAVRALRTHKGIGPKVAACICLFGLGHVDAFPIDTHVKQLMAKYYPDGLDLDFFKGMGGIIQQYLFYYELR